jgi:general secretion pathway protein L
VNHNLLLIAFPTTDDEPLYWWHVKDGAVQAWGCDPDPLIASQAYGPDAAQGDVRVVALVPSHLTSIMGHDAISDANESQALAAATMAAKAQSLESEKVHIVAAIDGAGGVVTASVGRDILSSGLVHLQALAIDPDAVIPSGWLLPVAGDGSVSADFGFDQVVRAGNIIAIDDPVFRELLFTDLTVKPITGDDFDAMLVGASDKSDLNFRSGPFAKKTQRAMDAKQKRRLGWMAVALVIVSLAIPLVQLAQYHWAASAADEAALADAAAVVGEQDNPGAAERALDQRLIAENRGNIMFPVPASALFSALQQVPNVSITRMDYGENGIVSATLSAVRNEDINPVLLAIQEAGFIITATPRTDATGSAQADITVRAP